MIHTQRLRCPECQGSLTQADENNLKCALCAATFDISNGIFRLISKKLGDFKDTEKNFWDYQYKGKDIKYEPDRDQVFHDQFKKPLKDLPQDSNVLEVACGWRLDGIEIAKTGKNITAIDLSEQAMPISKSLAKQAGVQDRISFATADAANLPFQDNIFDGAFIAASIHHLPYPEEALKEMARVVKPGQPVVLGVEPNTWPYYSVYPLLSPLKWVIRRMRKRPYDSVADDFTHGFTERKLMQMLWMAELKVETIERVKYLEEFYEKYLALLERFRINAQLDRARIDLIRRIDGRLSQLPISRNLNWYWNVIGRTRKN